RDYGNRTDRKLARLKYTLDNVGVDWFKQELQKRTGFALEDPRPYRFTTRSDYFGWQADDKGRWHYTVFVENGRVTDDENMKLKSALLAVAKTGKANFRFTASQNVILSDVSERDKGTLEGILEHYGVIRSNENSSLLRKNSMACVALNTCPL